MEKKEEGHSCYACEAHKQQQGCSVVVGVGTKKKYNSVGDLIKHCIREHTDTTIASSPTDSTNSSLVMRHHHRR
jgi:hypothetical protein